MFPSFKSALRFAFSPITFLFSFGWTAALLLLAIVLISLVLSLGTDSLLLQPPLWVRWLLIILSVTGTIASLLIFTAFLIWAKKEAFQLPPTFTFSFLLRKGIVIVPTCFATGMLTRILFYSAMTAYLQGNYMKCLLLVLSAFGVLYLFTAFLIAFLKRFDWQSLSTLFLPVLSRPLPILLIWGYAIVYAILTGLLAYASLWLIQHSFGFFVRQIIGFGFNFILFVLTGGALGAIYAGLFRFLPQRLKLWLLLSVLFVIPNAIILLMLGAPFGVFINGLVLGQVFCCYLMLLSFITIGYQAFTARLIADACRHAVDTEVPTL